MNLHGLTMDQKIDWERDGYIVLEDFLSEQEVEKYNAALDRALDAWKAKGSTNPEVASLQNIGQIHNLIEWDEEFYKLMSYPKTMQIMRDLFGDQFILFDNDGLIKPPNTETHTKKWHRDAHITITNFEKKYPFMAKIFYYFSDVPEDGGCLSLLPGSVHLRNDQLPEVEDIETLPGMVKMNVKKGTAIIFNSSTLHVALDNKSKDATRRNAYFSYAPAFIKPFPTYEASEASKAKAKEPVEEMLLGMHSWISGPNVFKD